MCFVFTFVPFAHCIFSKIRNHSLRKISNKENQAHSHGIVSACESLIWGNGLAFG